MKPTIRVPYFEVGTKNYVWGDKLLEYAIAADKAAEKYDIDVLFIVPALEVRRVAENTKNLFVLATYMDTLYPGRGCADILPEGLKAAGAVGVMINHCEKPMSLPQMKKTIDRARELDFLVFACADTLDEAKAIALDRVPGATDIRIYLDRDDARVIYEGTIIYNEMKYDFEIDAQSGNMIEWDAESIYDD